MREQDLFLRTYPFMLVFFVFVMFGLGMLAYFGKDELHIEFNQYNHYISDVFLKYYTDVGTTGTTIFILIYLIWKKTWRHLVLFASSFAVVTLIASVVKRVFFIHVHRPTYYFDQKGIDLHLVEGVLSQIPYTFPSGHSANAFLCFLFLSILFKNKWLQVVFALLACLVAISRVYLSKHFVLDTVAGGFLGVFVLFFMFYLIRNWNKPWLDELILKKK